MRMLIHARLKPSGDWVWHFQVGAHRVALRVDTSSQAKTVRSACTCYPAVCNLGEPRLCCTHAQQAVQHLVNSLERGKNNCPVQRASQSRGQASRANGKLGGRPQGSRDSKPRIRRWKYKP